MARKRKKKRKKNKIEPIEVTMRSEDGTKILGRYTLKGADAKKVREAAQRKNMALEDFVKSSVSRQVLEEVVVRAKIKDMGLDPDQIQKLPHHDRENFLRLIRMLHSENEAEKKWAMEFMDSTEELPPDKRFKALNMMFSIRDGYTESGGKFERMAEIYGKEIGLGAALSKQDLAKALKDTINDPASLLKGYNQVVGDESERTLKKYDVLPVVGVSEKGETWGMFDHITRRHFEYKVVHDGAVDNYLQIIQWCLRYAKELDQKNRELYSHLWSHMRNAAIFALPASLYLQFYRQVESWLSQTYGNRWTPEEIGELDGRQQVSLDALSPMYKWIKERSQAQSLPEKMPFDRVFLGYEPPLIINEVQRSVQYIDKRQTGKRVWEVFLLGHLVTRLSVTSMMIVLEDGGTVAFMAFSDLDERGWECSSSCVPWVVPAIIDWINEHRTVVEDRKSLSYKRKMQKAGKALKVRNLLPPPYYTVYLKDELVQEIKKYGESRFKREIEWQHRWTVRGHWMVRVKRGPLPLDAEAERDLRRRKYKVFTLEQPDFETWKHLQQRGVQPKRVDEWMAVLISWRKDYVKGPEDKPLIPSVRKSAKKRRQHEEIDQR